MSFASSRNVRVRRSRIRDNEVWQAVFHLHSSEVVLEDVEVEHRGEPVKLVATESVPYYLTHDGWTPPALGMGKIRFVGGALRGDLELPLPGAPGILFEGVDRADSSPASTDTAADRSGPSDHRGDAIEPGFESDSCGGLQAVIDEQAALITDLEAALAAARAKLGED